MNMTTTMVIYACIYLAYRLIFSYGANKNSINFFVGLIIIAYWVYKNRKNFREFLNNFKEDVRQGQLIYTLKQFFNLKRLFFGRLRHESINIESLSYRDANRIYNFIKQGELKEYSPTLNKIRTKDEIRSFINKSVSEYRSFDSINLKIVYNTIFYIPLGPRIFGNFFFRRLQKFYKKFIYRYDKKIISLPVINFTDKGHKIVTLEWNFDNYYKKYEKNFLNKLTKLLFKKMEISKIIVSCFLEDLKSQNIFGEIGFEEKYREENLITYEFVNPKSY